jgi:hypothetical protein
MYALEPTVNASGVGDHDGGEDKTAEHVGVSAEELGNLSVLLPCKRKRGKLYLGA